MTKKPKKSESGAIMIEGMIVMIVTILMLVWILGVGFLYYQKYVVRIATNDAAKKIAATYDAPTSDIIMGYISANDLQNRKLYTSVDATDANSDRTESYVNYILDKSNFFGTVKSADVVVNYTSDALGRSHVAVTTECTFMTPFGAGLEFFGMSEIAKYSVTAYADSTSLSEYVSTITITNSLTDGTYLSGTGFIETAVKTINSIKSMCNQKFNKDEKNTQSTGGSSGGGGR